MRSVDLKHVSWTHTITWRWYIAQNFIWLPDEQYHVVSLDNISGGYRLVMLCSSLINPSLLCVYVHLNHILYMNMLMCCFLRAGSRDVIVPEGGREAEVAARAAHGLTLIWTRHRSWEMSRSPFCCALHYHWHTYFKCSFIFTALNGSVLCWLLHFVQI